MKCEMCNIGVISIIMAAYNAENTIESSIQSVLGQTYLNFELIVIDDCSTDKTVEIIEKFKDSRIRLVKNDKNLGVSKTRFRGIEEARGEWVAILDSDDLWDYRKLEKQAELQIKTGAELIFTGSSFINNDGKYVDWQLHVPEEIEYTEVLKQNLISNSSVLVKKILYRQYYVINDNLHEDFAVWIKILKGGRRAYGIDEPLLTYRISGNSKSGNKIKAAKMNWNTYRHCGLNVVISFYYMCWYFVRSIKKYRHLYLK